MSFTSILITGGAGFVGSNLALLMKQKFPALKVLALDNLKRRGSELNIGRLQSAGVRFLHGDVRSWEDLEGLGEIELLIDCSAEPSVLAGASGSPRYVLNTNLLGTLNCLELARLRKSAFLFLSTSRVYPIHPLNDLPFHEDTARFRWYVKEPTTGFSEHGIAESFSLEGARSFYGASKLSCELLLQEYVQNYGMKGLINRCGILAGPWQMGKVDQGVITLWVARHFFRQPLKYIGFGGKGKQVRDLLHVADLFDLICLQMQSMTNWDGRVYNVGGGPEVSLSLCELTSLCEAATGHRIEIESIPQTSALDLRIYLSDIRKVERDFGWRPKRKAQQIVEDIRHWVEAHPATLRAILE